MQVALYIVAVVMLVTALVTGSRPNTPTNKGLRWFDALLFGGVGSAHLITAVNWPARGSAYPPYLIVIDVLVGIGIYAFYAINEGKESTVLPPIGVYEILCRGKKTDHTHVIALIPDSTGGRHRVETHLAVPNAEVREGENLILAVYGGGLQIRPLGPGEQIRRIWYDE